MLHEMTLFNVKKQRYSKRIDGEAIDLLKKFQKLNHCKSNMRAIINEKGNWDIDRVVIIKN